MLSDMSPRKAATVCSPFCVESLLETNKQGKNRRLTEAENRLGGAKDGGGLRVRGRTSNQRISQSSGCKAQRGGH